MEETKKIEEENKKLEIEDLNRKRVREENKTEEIVENPTKKSKKKKPKKYVLLIAYIGTNYSGIQM